MPRRLARLRSRSSSCASNRTDTGLAGVRRRKDVLGEGAHAPQQLVAGFVLRPIPGLLLLRREVRYLLGALALAHLPAALSHAAHLRWSSTCFRFASSQSKSTQFCIYSCMDAPDARPPLRSATRRDAPSIAASPNTTYDSSCHKPSQVATWLSRQTRRGRHPGATGPAG